MVKQCQYQLRLNLEHERTMRESYWDYMSRRIKEEEQQPIWQHDMAQMTDSYYSALKRIKQLVEENNILQKKVEELSNSQQMELNL